MKRVFTLITLLIPFSSFAQNQFGISINPGISMPTKSFTAGRTTFDAGIAPSLSAGLWYKHQVGGFQFGTRIMFNQIESKDKLSTIFIENGRQTGISNTRFEQHMLYFSIPICFGWQKENYGITAGFRSSLLLSSSATELGHYYYNGNYSKIENEYDILEIHNYDYGPEISFTYSLNDQFEFDFTAYHGLVNISTQVPSPWIWRIKQATIGIKYLFYSKP